MERLFGLDAQLLFEVVLSMIAVFVLFLALSYILFNPVRDMLKKRQEMVQETKDTANKEKEDALKLKAEYDATGTIALPGLDDSSWIYNEEYWDF